MKTFNYIQYLPQRFFTLDETFKKNRKFVIDFKDGVRYAQDMTCDRVAMSLIDWYGLKIKDIVVVCAPASSARKYAHRFKRFAAMLTAKTRVQNGTAHVTIYGEKQSYHTGGRFAAEPIDYRVTVDEDFFRGKKVIIFDDLYTTGKTAEKFAEILTQAGAEVVGGLFLAKTVHTDGTHQRLMTNKEFFNRYKH